jgi:hypothetical protein
VLGAAKYSNQMVLGANRALYWNLEKSVTQYVPNVERRLPLVDKAISKYMAEIGRKGGFRSSRTLTTEQSKAMLKKREEKRLAITSTTKVVNFCEPLPIQQTVSPV